MSKQFSIYQPENFARPFQIRVILVRPIYPRNIGAVSRSMSNMGADRLILIAPQCEITYDAQQSAATGQEALQGRVVYGSWEDFFSNEAEGLRLSFTARDGRGRIVKNFKDVLTEIAQQAPQVRVESPSPLFVDLIFGPEDWGLSAEDLELSHFCCSLPTYGENWSLNLAQAVMLALFVLRDTWGGTKTHLDGASSRKPSPRAQIFPEKALHAWLEEMGFDLSKKKINAYTVLKRMLLRSTPTEKELRVFEIVIQQSIRKLKEYNELRQRIKSKT